MSEEVLHARDALALTLFDIGAVQFGKFVLHSGKKSNIYLDLRVLVSFPDALRQVAGALSPILTRLRYDVMAATPLAGLPIGTALCHRARGAAGTGKYRYTSSLHSTPFSRGQAQVCGGSARAWRVMGWEEFLCQVWLCEQTC